MALQITLLPKIQMPPLSSVSSSSSRASATKYVYKQEHTTPLCPSLRPSCCPQWTTRFQTGCAPCTNGKFAPFEREKFVPCPGKFFSLTREKILAAQHAGHSLAIARLRPANTCSSPTPHRHTCEKKSNAKNHNKPRFRHHSQTTMTP